ncbi:chloride channel protein [Deltaproteobacteria bacterium OttesenSCG-928-K17]|nr:chloride channel protein [Deltaproteobacteria bacterium OttesenSCG-928-K17]
MKNFLKIISGGISRRTLIFWAGTLLVGLAAYGLGVGAGAAFNFFQKMGRALWWWPLLSLPAGGLALTWFMRRVGPGTEGSGIQQAVAAIAVSDRPAIVGWFINLRLAAAKFMAIIVGMGSGFVLGLEGPTVQIGASILYSFRKHLGARCAVARRQLVMAGGAAGIAAAFNAPLAGLMFAFEELGRSVNWHASVKVAVGVILAGAAAFALRGRHAFFGLVPLAPVFDPALIAILFATTIAGAAVGGGFAWLATRTEAWLPEPLRAFRLAHPYFFVIFCGLIIALLGFIAPIHGSGLELTGEMLRAGAEVPWYYVPLKMGGLLLTLLTGVPGGIFSPSLSLGAGVGCWFLPLGAEAWQAEIIAIGMIAVLSAVTRAPLTSAFIVVEMTGGQSMSIEALGAALLAAQLARLTHVKFYHDLAGRALKAVPDSIKKSDDRREPSCP